MIRSAAWCSSSLAAAGSRPTDGQRRRRLDDPNDVHRHEIALARTDLTVIPVRVGDATVPSAGELPEELRALTERQFFYLGDRKLRREADMSRLAGRTANTRAVASATLTGDVSNRQCRGRYTKNGRLSVERCARRNRLADAPRRQQHRYDDGSNPPLRERPEPAPRATDPPHVATR